MSYIKSQTALMHPNIPGDSSIEKTVWVGIGGRYIGDGGKIAFYDTRLKKYLITELKFVYDLEIDGDTYEAKFSDVNGYIYWEYSGRYFYYSATHEAWVLCGKFPGYEPVETETKNKNEETGNEETVYGGDEFYSGSFLGTNASLSPRGKNKKSNASENTNLDVTVVFPRWESNTEFGEYEPKDGASGTRILGVPKWQGNDGKDYIRSADKDGSYYRYGSIHYENGKWIIGMIDSPSGWWEGNEPKPKSGETFTFKKPEGSDIKGENISLSWVGYVHGEETETGYVGQVAICY